MCPAVADGFVYLFISAGCCLSNRQVVINSPLLDLSFPSTFVQEFVPTRRRINFKEMAVPGGFRNFAVPWAAKYKWIHNISTQCRGRRNRRRHSGFLPSWVGLLKNQTTKLPSSSPWLREEEAETTIVCLSFCVGLLPATKLAWSNWCTSSCCYYSDKLRVYLFRTA